jgi:hypothetical protein
LPSRPGTRAEAEPVTRAEPAAGPVVGGGPKSADGGPKPEAGGANGGGVVRLAGSGIEVWPG